MAVGQYTKVPAVNHSAIHLDIREGQSSAAKPLTKGSQKSVPWAEHADRTPVSVEADHTLLCAERQGLCNSTMFSKANTWRSSCYTMPRSQQLDVAKGTQPGSDGLQPNSEASNLVAMASNLIVMASNLTTVMQ